MAVDIAGDGGDALRKCALVQDDVILLDRESPARTATTCAERWP